MQLTGLARHMAGLQITVGHRTHYTFFAVTKSDSNSLNLHFAIKFTRHSSILFNVAPGMDIHTCLVTYRYLVTYICPTKFSGVGFCPTKFKLCPTKIKSDRTNVLSSQIFICSPAWADSLINPVSARLSN